MLRKVIAGKCALVDPDDHADSPREITPRVALEDADVRLLVRLLLDPDAWFFARKQCLPKGTALFCLEAPPHEATVLIGMSCQSWHVFAAGFQAGAFFDPVVNDIRGILKRAFPAIASREASSLWQAGAIARMVQSLPP
jgi:hypothetical protein